MGWSSAWEEEEEEEQPGYVVVSAQTKLFDLFTNLCQIPNSQRYP